MHSWLHRLTQPDARDASGKPVRGSLLLNDFTRRFLPYDQREGARASTLAMAMLDMLVFCGAALALGAWAWPQDAFGAQASFAWIWLVPAMIALRHGSSVGVGAIVFYVLAWVLLRAAHLGGLDAAAEFPKSFFLGGVTLVLLCGQFSDLWHARSRRLNGVNDYLEERLRTLTKSHFLLRLSHERLEQDLLVKPVTLRETLARLRTLTMGSEMKPGDELPAANEFIELLGQSCQLEVASLYALDAQGKLLGTPLASIGSAGVLAAEDPLVRFCLAENKLTHVQTDALSQEDREISQYLIAAPLLPSVGPPIGLLLVEKLPFLALNDETLQLLSVLTDYYADGLNLDAATRKILAKVPACPPNLALDIVRLHRVRLHGGIDSSIVALVFQNDDASLDILEQVKRLKRGVDQSWEFTGARNTVLLTLLPLAGSAAVEGYLLRVEDALRAQFNSGFLGSGVAIHTARLGFSPPAATLSHLVARCGL